MKTSKVQNLYDSREYKRSRVAYCLEAAFEYFVSLLVTDAFLAELLSHIGFSDGVIGILSSLVSLSCLFQLLAVFVVHRVSDTKKFCVLFHCICQLFFMLLYIVPFLPFAYEYKAVIAVVCIIVAYAGKYLVTMSIFKWSNIYVDPHKRASYAALKEMISLVSGMVVTFIIGYCMDVFKASDNIEGGFIFAAIGILIFSVCDFICLMLIKNDKRTPEQKAHHAPAPMREIAKSTLGNKYFRNVIIVNALWQMAMYVSVGFLGTYRIKELAFTVGAVQVINIAANLMRFFLSRPFGRYSDKHSYENGITLGFVIAAASFISSMVTTPEMKYMIVVHTVLYAVGLAGISQNLSNITYNYVDEKYFVQASAIKNSIGGVCGFGISILAGYLLEYIQANGNMLFGFRVYGQQVLSAISLIIVVIAILYMKLGLPRKTENSCEADADNVAEQ